MRIAIRNPSLHKIRYIYLYGTTVMYIYYVVYGEHARHELNTKNINIINGNNVVIFACLLVFLNYDL